MKITDEVLRRFNAKINFEGELPDQSVSSYVGLDRCHVWTASKKDTGYGKFAFQGKTWLAHRVSWLINRGCIPLKTGVLHKCDNPACVNPSHLFLGNQSDNMKDSKTKGRNPRGASHWSVAKPDSIVRGVSSPWSKLTESEVLEIRSSYERGGVTCSDLAERFGVRELAIWKIINGKSWTHLPFKIPEEAQNPNWVGEAHAAKVVGVSIPTFKKRATKAGVRCKQLKRAFGGRKWSMEDILEKLEISGQCKATKLLPCPFCGSAGLITKGGSESHPCWIGHCSNYTTKLADGGCMVRPSTPPRYSEKEAIMDWNRRMPF